ncbi:PIR protein [Plasmodium ovale]|uniref:PIR protein n=1 Tax=Plasmodium ovale TaxID=36330 RepID=A0A1C3KJZ6_PLAOA|nr:PIR protein [Plasmodium ovale]
MSRSVEFRDLLYLPSKLVSKEFDNLENNYCSVHFDKEDIIERVKSNLKLYQQIRNDADKIVNVICKASTIDVDNPECTERCNYLYYQIGDVFIDKLINVDLFSNVSEELRTLMDSISTRFKCKCNFTFTNVNKDDFNDMKDAYFYYKDYEKNEALLQHYNHLCDDGYNTYIKTAFQKYDKVYEACKNENSKTYCNQLKNKDSIYLGEKLPEMTCRTIENSSQYQALNSPGFELGHSQENPDDASTPKSVIFISFFFALLGIIFLSLYKFTPLGSWIHSHLLFKRKMHFNMNNLKMPKFKEQFDDNEQNNLNMKRFNVSYHGR